MKKLSILIGLILYISSLSYAKNSNNLSVEITGIKNTRGDISIGLYSNKKDFPKKGKFSKGTFIKATGAKVSHVFKNVPDGKYAVAVFHDENLNKKLDKNFIGKPKEGYGFSNNIFGMFGPPKFKKVSFILNADKIIKIKLEY